MPRSREFGIVPGIFSPGTRNAITDVPGVRVGHATLHQGKKIHTGVTVIAPHLGNPVKEKVPAAFVVGNGFGKSVGTLQINELGQLESYLALTNTLAVGTVMEALKSYHLRQPGNEDVFSLNVFVGETNDKRLNDIRRSNVTAEHVEQAIHSLSETVEEGAVGAGAGTVCFDFKGGIGTSSRVLPKGISHFEREYHVGVLVQSNYGGILRIGGVEVGKTLSKHYFAKDLELLSGGSIMIIVATDAPVDYRQLGRIAKRALIGLGNTGSFMGAQSGDFVLAFSNASTMPHNQKELRHGQLLDDNQLNPLFQATVEATEEAIYNSLFMAQDVDGFEMKAEALRWEVIHHLF